MIALPLTEAPRRPGAAVGLPAYAWDDRLRNYVDQATGRMVKRVQITDLLRTVVAGSEGRLGTLGSLYANGQLTGRQFYELMAREIKLATNTATALASGGWHGVSPAGWGRNGAICRTQYGFLRGFVQEVEAARLAGTPMSEAALVARAKLYADPAYARYWEIEQAGQRARGIQREKLIPVLDDRTCSVCVAESKRGWQPIGTWRVPLHNACRCDLAFENNAGTAQTAITPRTANLPPA